MSIWIMVIMATLVATGWKPYVAPDISKRTIGLLGILIAVLLPSSIWWSPMPAVVQVQLHVTVCLLLLSTFFLLRGSENWSYRGYLVLCAFMIAVIWGSIRKIYIYDPVFYWLDPSWDAPIIGGLLCGAFTSEAKHQFGLIIWGAVLGECLNAVLQSGAYTAQIGSLSWWDSFWIAIASARLFSLLLKLIRMTISKLGIMLWHIKGGRSS
ncbi:YphA family membrane protein [Paenibacillus alkaliterrae]